MVTAKQNRKKECGSVLMAELMVAMMLLAVVLIPLTVGFLKGGKQMRDLYLESVAMELVDGEMEVLAASGADGIPSGSQPYLINAGAATNLPPGKFTLIREEKTLRLEWRANEPLEHLRVDRKISLP